MPRLRRLITVLLLLFTLVPLGKPLGMVLCFGADGHIAFEPAHNRTHHTFSPTYVSSHPQAAQVLAGVEHAGSCVDVTSLVHESNGQLLPASDTHPKLATLEAVLVLLLMPVSTERPEPSILPDVSVFRHPSLTILRSVVLHI